MKKRLYITLGTVLLFALAGVIVSCKKEPLVVSPQSAGVMDVIVPTYGPTDEPGLRINNKSAGAESFVVEDAGTPVYTVGGAGAVSQTGDQSVTGDLSITGAGAIAAPTAQATAEPALSVDNDGVSQVASFQDGGSEVLGIINGGKVSVSGYQAIAAPTAQPTAEPALEVDSLGVSNLLEVRDAATPVFTVHDGGSVTGNVVRYATAGQQMVVGTDTITDTATAAHGLTTVTFALCTLGVDVDTDAGDPVVCTVAVSGNTVTLKLWQDDWSAAATASQAVHWLVVGTP